MMRLSSIIRTFESEYLAQYRHSKLASDHQALAKMVRVTFRYQNSKTKQMILKATPGVSFL
ncbi:MAG: hypothetical protein H6936_13415 [Burkholderiales bacterium]|nr:hypothetical protein [Burkholderiales bacterium]